VLSLIFAGITSYDLGIFALIPLVVMVPASVLLLVIVQRREEAYDPA
jgi:hypothetical protein